jgi:hypothetical protein
MPHKTGTFCNERQLIKIQEITNNDMAFFCLFSATFFQILPFYGVQFFPGVDIFLGASLELFGRKFGHLATMEIH